MNFTGKAGANFLDLNGMEGVRDYGDTAAEYRALREAAGDSGFEFPREALRAGGGPDWLFQRPGDQ